MTINILIIAAAFSITFILNHQFFDWFVVNEYVALVFIPSGVRIFAVLVFDLAGAVGIFLGSLVVSFAYLGQTNIEIAVCAAFIAGGSALLSRYLCERLFKLDANLRDITLSQIYKICVVFSFISSVSHQLFYQAEALGTDFFADTAKMFIGDISGAIVFLVATKFFMGLIQRLK